MNQKPNHCHEFAIYKTMRDAARKNPSFESHNHAFCCTIINDDDDNTLSKILNRFNINEQIAVQRLKNLSWNKKDRDIDIWVRVESGESGRVIAKDIGISPMLVVRVHQKLNRYMENCSSVVHSCCYEAAQKPSMGDRVFDILAAMELDDEERFCRFVKDPRKSSPAAIATWKHCGAMTKETILNTIDIYKRRLGIK